MLASNVSRMATISTLADDFDGTTPAETYNFIVGDKEYVIDLNEEHAEELKSLQEQFAEKMAPYVRAGRSIGKANPRRSSSSSNKPSYDASAVREWAKGEGIEVSERGRISGEVLEAYENRGNKKS